MESGEKKFDTYTVSSLGFYRSLFFDAPAGTTTVDDFSFPFFDTITP